MSAPGSSFGRCRTDLRKRRLTCGDERQGCCVQVLAVARCSSSLSAVLRTECGLGLVLLDGLLHALLEVVERGERYGTLVPLRVHERVRSSQEVWRVLAGDLSAS